MGKGSGQDLSIAQLLLVFQSTSAWNGPLRTLSMEPHPGKSASHQDSETGYSYINVHVLCGIQCIFVREHKIPGKKKKISLTVFIWSL